MKSDDYQKQGCALLPGAFTDWVKTLRAGVERNMREPGPFAAENTAQGEAGRFFDDYCNWQRIPEFKDFIENSNVGEVAAALMGSTTAQIFHDHILVKEPGTAKPTPWHQDMPYYFVEGRQTVSLWIPLDPVTEENTLLFLTKSHLSEKFIRPVKWLNDGNFYEGDQGFMDVPEPGVMPKDHAVSGWAMAPGDAAAFDFRCAHGARGNTGPTRRRAFSVRFVGDDARYVTRPGKTSPPFPGHGMTDGERLREDWFPVIWRAESD